MCDIRCMTLTIEQIAEVNRAVNECYTNEEIFQFIKDGSWTFEMFDSFINKLATQRAKDEN